MFVVYVVIGTNNYYVYSKALFTYIILFGTNWLWYVIYKNKLYLMKNDSLCSLIFEWYCMIECRVRSILISRLPFLGCLVTGLAGATSDVHCYDVLTNKWSRYDLIWVPGAFAPLFYCLRLTDLLILLWITIILILSCAKFCRITPFGEPPTPRAAHVATAVGTMVVIQVCRQLAIPEIYLLE